MPKDTSTVTREFIAGAFVATGIALLVLFVFTLGGITSTWRPTKTLSVRFSYLGGLKSGQPVLYSGYRVGTVESINIARGPENGLITKLRIPKDLTIYEGSEFLVSSSGIVGDKVLEIVPPEKPTSPIKTEKVLKGNDPINVARMLDQFSDVFGKDSRAKVHDLLSNAGIATKNLAEVSQNFVKLSDSLKSLTNNNDTKINRILTNLAEGSGEFRQFVTKAETTASSIRSLSNQLSELSGENRQDLRTTLENLKEASKDLKGFSRKVEKKPWRLLWGED